MKTQISKTQEGQRTLTSFEGKFQACPAAMRQDLYPECKEGTLVCIQELPRLIGSPNFRKCS